MNDPAPSNPAPSDPDPSNRAPSDPAPTVWLPEPVSAYDGLPDGPDYRLYDGTDEPDSLEGVEFYVLPYLVGGRALEIAAKMPSLRVLQTLTAGVEHIRPFVRPGVRLCNARGVHDASTAELAVALILAALRGIPDYVRAQEHHDWGGGRRESLADKRVLIIGYGSIGAALERRLDGFECEVLRIARHARDIDAGPVYDMTRLPALLPTADVVVLLVPATDQTRGMVDASFLARMKDGALLCNVARGAIVDTDALVAELTAHRLGAALDVTDPEPLPPGHPLWDAPNLVLSPHVGGNTSAFVPRGRRLVVEQLQRYVAGQPLANVVDGSY